MVFGPAPSIRYYQHQEVVTGAANMEAFPRWRRPVTSAALVGGVRRICSGRKGEIVAERWSVAPYLEHSRSLANLEVGQDACADRDTRSRLSIQLAADGPCP